MSRSIIDQAIYSNAGISFTYTKYNGERTTRYVSNISYSNEFGEYGYNNDHIKGYCHLRNAERTFRISRMSNISLIRNQNIYSSYSTLIDSINLRAAQNYKANKPKEGCYIATLVYGSYNHPSVIVLRDYRDSVLAKRWWGRLLIQIYYTISPHMVNFLSHIPYLQKGIKNILDKTVEALVCREK